jgi:hypothetical protein
VIHVALIRLYSPALVLMVWSLTWWAGVRGDVLLAVWLLAFAFAVGDHIRVAPKRYRDSRRT